MRSAFAASPSIVVLHAHSQLSRSRVWISDSFSPSTLPGSHDTIGRSNVSPG